MTLAGRNSLILGLSLVLACALPAAASAAMHQVGVATANADGRVLYREHHFLFEETGTPRRLVLYHCPDGAPFARKLIDEGAGATTPDFDFVDGRDGSGESVRRHAGGRAVVVRKPGGGTRRAELPERSGAVIDAGFDAFVRSHWDRLAKDEPVDAPYLVPGRAQWLEFRLKKAGDAVEAGVRVRRIRMTLAMWFGFALPAVELTYAIDDRRLLRFRGPGYVRDDGGHHPKVSIDFPAPPAPAAVAEVAAAKRAPLTGRCPG
jgi:hypothetical protein